MNVGTRVMIDKPGVREHGSEGTVTDWNEQTGWASVEIDRGPPWRGKYELGELNEIIEIGKSGSP